MSTVSAFFCQRWRTHIHLSLRIYIERDDKREETVEREEGKKKGEKKIIQKGTLLTQGRQMNNGHSCLSFFFPSLPTGFHRRC